MLLTKETLDNFLNGEKSLLEAELLWDNTGDTWPCTLFKRRAGKYTHVLYFISNAPLTGDRTLDPRSCQAYAVMLFAPHRREVFLTYDPSFLCGLNEQLHRWYADQNVIPEGKMANIGHRLTSMYLRDNLGQSDAEDENLIAQYKPSLCDALSNHGEHFVGKVRNPNFNGFVIRGNPESIAAPCNVVYTGKSCLISDKDVYNTCNVRLSAYDAFYSYNDEESYIAALYEDLKETALRIKNSDPSQVDPVMHRWASNRALATEVATNPLFKKLNEIKKALEVEIKTKTVLVIFEDKRGKEHHTRLYPDMFRRESLKFFVTSDNGNESVADAVYLEYGDPAIGLSEIKEIKSCGKTLYRCGE